MRIFTVYDYHTKYAHIGGFDCNFLINKNIFVITNKYKYLSLDGVLFYEFGVDFSIFAQCTYEAFHVRGDVKYNF